MKSKRLLEIAKLVDKEDTIIDVGCDHAYLGIYLKQNNLCKDVICTDISENAIKNAKKNILDNNLDIKCYVSDGLNNISDYYDTIVVAGLGTNTIKNILNNHELPNKLIISSHNEHYKLRKYLNNIGYKIIKEIIVLENNHYYVILKCIKGYQKLSKKYLKFGISNNKEYFKYLIDKNNNLINKVNFKKKIELYLDNLLLKKLIEE